MQLFLLGIKVLGFGIRILAPRNIGGATWYLFLITVQTAVFYALISDWSPYWVICLVFLTVALTVLDGKLAVAAAEVIGFGVFEFSFYEVTLFNGAALY